MGALAEHYELLVEVGAVAAGLDGLEHLGDDCAGLFYFFLHLYSTNIINLTRYECFSL